MPGRAIGSAGSWQAVHMTDRSPAPEPVRAPDGAEPDPGSEPAVELGSDVSVEDDPGDAPAQDRSLTNRWWWQGAVLVITGIAIIGWQWSIVTTGKAIPATWVMIVIGAAVILFGAVMVWRDRPQRVDSSAAE